MVEIREKCQKKGENKGTRLFIVHDALLQRKLGEQGDTFRPAADYIAQWGYRVDANGTVPYTP